MKKELSVKERVALLALLLGRTPEERHPRLSESGLTRREWEALPGLVELVDNEGQLAPPPPKRRAPLFVRPTDEAWAWASQHLAGPVAAVKPRKEQKSPPKTPPKKKGRSVNAVSVLEALLSHLEQYFEASGETLATLVSKRSDPVKGDVSADLAARILEESLDLAGGIKRRVRLKDLRERLSDVGKEELDRELLSLQSAERLVLYRLDNPAEVTRADEEAALFVAGNPRHIIYLEA